MAAACCCRDQIRARNYRPSARKTQQPKFLVGWYEDVHRAAQIHRATKLCRELYSAVMSYRAIQRARYTRYRDLHSYRAIPSHRVTELCKTIQSRQGQWNIAAELQIYRCYRATPSYRAIEGVYSVEIFVLFAEAERARPVHCVVTAPLFEANILISPLL